MQRRRPVTPRIWRTDCRACGRLHYLLARPRWCCPWAAAPPSGTAFSRERDLGAYFHPPTAGRYPRFHRRRTPRQGASSLARAEGRQCSRAGRLPADSDDSGQNGPRSAVPAWRDPGAGPLQGPARRPDTRRSLSADQVAFHAGFQHHDSPDGPDVTGKRPATTGHANC